MVWSARKSGARNDDPQPAEGGVLRQSQNRFLLIAVVGCAGFVISLVFSWLLLSREQQLVRAQFNLDAEKRIETIQRVMLSRLALVDTLAAFFFGSQMVDRDEFQTFCDLLVQHETGVYALAWAPEVADARRQLHEQAVRRQGLANYRIVEGNDRGDWVPAAKREVHYPILFVEPWRTTQAMLGLDLAGKPIGRKALDEARRTEKPVAVVAPPWDGNELDTYLLYVFKAASNELSKSDSEKQPETQGFVLGIFRIEAILNAAFDFFVPVGLDFHITVHSPEHRNAITMTRPSRLRARSPHGEAATALARFLMGDMRLTSDLNIAGSQWKIECTPINAYLQDRHHLWAPTTALVGGIFATFLIAGYLYLATGRTLQVERLVAERTRALRDSEQRFRRLVDNAGDAFFLHDEKGHLIDVSKRACDSLGYSREELLSMKVPDVDVSFDPQQDPLRHWALPNQAYPVTFEGTHRRKDGTTFPVEIRLAPLEIGGQRFMLALARDITDRKHAEQEIQEEQRLLRDMLDMQERDRKLVAYEIHDGLAQQLTGAFYKLQSIDGLRDRDPAASQAILDEAVRLLGQSMAETRRLISGLRPPILDESGIVEAVEYLAAEQRQKGGPEIEVQCDETFGRLTPPLEGAIFRIVQESLTNACRYSRSEKVRVELTQANGQVHVDVQDWGVGFDAAQVAGGHYGLQGIRERARLLGGSATIDTAPNRGTRVHIILPLIPQAGEKPEADDLNQNIQEE